MIDTKCIWTNCDQPTGGNWFCRWHTLCKEANYALGDLNPDKNWGNTSPEMIDGFKKWGIERLKKLAQYAIENK